MELMLTGAAILATGFIGGGWWFRNYVHKPAMRRILTEECEARKVAVAAAEQRARENEGQS